MNGNTGTGSALLRRILARRRRWLIMGSALLGLHQLGEAAVPVLIGVIVDRAVATGSVPAIVGWIAALGALFVMLLLAYRLGARLVVRAQAYEANVLRVEFSRKVLDPRGLHTPHGTGALLSIASSDVDGATEVIDHVPTIVAALVATIAGGAVLLTIDVLLGVLVFVGIPLLVIVLQVAAPMIAARVEAQQDRIGRATALAADLIRGHRPLQGIGAQANAALRYRTANRRALDAALRAARLKSVHAGASAAAGALAAAAVAVLAAYVALAGDVSIGALITVIGLAQFLVEPFSELAIAPSWLANARGAANRVASVLTAPPRYDPPSGSSASRSRAGALKVSCTNHPRLQNLSLSAAPGEFVGVLTRDAAAAALLAAISAEVREAVEVTVDGHAIGELPYADRRATLLAERHDAHLFSGTIRSNLELSGAADFAAALDAARAEDVVDLHPDGLGHVIVERGANLSGGQRQRLALARALAADSAVLVLHDPTTAVDAITEALIADGVRRLRRGRTTIVVTTSPALLAVADRVLLVADGTVAAQGTHRELLDANEDYRTAVLR